MAAKCKKCDPHEICEECPEWIFTLADLIMCMMGLFVVLWVLKTEGEKSQNPATQSQDMINFLAGFKDAFGYVPDPNSTNPVDQAILRQTKGAGEKGRTNSTPEGAQGTEREVTSVRQGDETLVGGRVLFEAGDDQLSTQARAALDQIAEKTRGIKLIIHVKGHASLDDFPPDTSAQNKLALSLRRAQVVSDYLVMMGVDPEVIRVIGASTYEPIQERTYTTAGHAQNRRVSIETTDILVSELRDTPKTATPVEESGSTTSPSETKPESESHDSEKPHDSGKHGH
jgi:flagellar motor protein MotB